jgi:DNA-binding response OmpR family regulator
MDRPRKVLIVEDEPVTSWLLKELILDWGAELLTAEDGEQAREMAVRHQPDLILLDVRLPKQSGLDVLSALRAHPRTCNAKIVIVSVCRPWDILPRNAELEADAWIQKPVDLDTFGAMLLDVYQRKPANR